MVVANVIAKVWVGQVEWPASLWWRAVARERKGKQRLVFVGGYGPGHQAVSLLAYCRFVAQPGAQPDRRQAALADPLRLRLRRPVSSTLGIYDVHPPRRWHKL